MAIILSQGRHSHNRITLCAVKFSVYIRVSATRQLTGNVAVLEYLRHQLLGTHHPETCRQHAIERRRLASLTQTNINTLYLA